MISSTIIIYRIIRTMDIYELECIAYHSITYVLTLRVVIIVHSIRKVVVVTWNIVETFINQR